MPAVPTNRLLSSLSSASRRSLEQKLEGVSLPVGTQIFESGRVPKHTYFITSGIASVVADMENGGTIEVGLLGREGLPGCLQLLGAQTGATRCFMQVAGSGLQLSFDDLNKQFRSDPELNLRILQHVQYETLTLSQLSACNRLHELEERLARWILMISDRVESDVVHITQEFLGEMLGTRRPTVTTSAGILQRAGFIEYKRGQMRILDRESLVSAACECYPIVRRYQQNLYADGVPV